jgi:radical SAM superfamily enzyme YgiQ (UPF0313 family)
MESIIGRKINVNFHTPNGMHARFITPKLAKLLKKSGFIMPRIGLETIDPHMQSITGSKITNKEFVNSTKYLKEAGYKDGSYIAYIMLGMPGQNPIDAEETVKFAHECGAKISLSEYSPIPFTEDWETVRRELPSDDPLWHNNSVYPQFFSGINSSAQKIKLLAKNLNNCFT